MKKFVSSAKECNTSHNTPALSFFTASTSALLMILTSVLNVLILFVFYRNKNLLRKSIFHKMILNIALADLMTALISDTTSTSAHIKEGLGIPVSLGEVRLLHYGLFFINGASILTMSLLCFDRVFALLKPLKYMKGFNTKLTVIVMVSTWILSGLLTLPYFYIGYIQYLAVFSSTTVAITCLSLIVAAIVYRRKFTSFNFSASPTPTHSHSSEKDLSQSLSCDEPDSSLRSSPLPNKPIKYDNYLSVATNAVIYSPRSNLKFKKRESSIEQKVNHTFILLLVVFLLTYLPSVIMTMYMNLCRECDCMLIHTLRDLTILSILSSAFWRPLNFILRLKTIRRGVQDAFCKRDTNFIEER